MTEHGIWEITIALAGSFLAGAINTFAGNGSVITLSILTSVLGLPGNLANGTNRVGIFLQSVASGTGFAKNRLLDLRKSGSIIITTLAGALAGVYTATIVSDDQFLFVFKYLMILMLIIILVKPERWLHSSEEKVPISQWVKIPVFLALGFYGGFIQMGVGLFILAVAVLISKYTLMEANVLKTIVIMIYTGFVLCIFAWKGMVDWSTGLIMAAGQSAGGYLTALYGSRMPDINVWSYRLLVAIIVFAIFIEFNIIHL